MPSEAEATIHEEAFVNCFIVKDRRARFLFEQVNRRGSFLGRFCHDALGVLMPQFVTVIRPPNSDPGQIFKLLREKGSPERCYSMSMNDDLDGRFLPLGEALELAIGLGMPSIVSCLPGELVYLETEQEAGPPDRLLLHRPSATSH